MVTNVPLAEVVAFDTEKKTLSYEVILRLDGNKPVYKKDSKGKRINHPVTYNRDAIEKWLVDNRRSLGFGLSVALKLHDNLVTDITIVKRGLETGI